MRMSSAIRLLLSMVTDAVKDLNLTADEADFAEASGALLCMVTLRFKKRRGENTLRILFHSSVA